jgi:putative flippase GtrA
MKLNQLTLNLEFIKFVIIGGFAALVNFISRFFLNITFNYVTSVIIAYIFGMITAYLLCRLFVFQSSKNNKVKQIFYFTLVNIFAVLQTVLVSLFFVNYAFSWMNDINLREALAHFIWISITVFTSYIGHKYITFRR